MSRAHPLSTVSDPQGLTPTPRPTLHLSGGKLRAALELVIRASEAIGGVERFVEALKLKSQVIAERLGDGRAATLARADFEEMCPLMATVRRRAGPLIDAQGWPHVRGAIVDLLRDAHVPGTADARVAQFEAELVGRSEAGTSAGRSPTFGSLERRTSRSAQSDLQHSAHMMVPDPQGLTPRPTPRFIRDLAAEILHGVHPEHYPLMTRWVWDAKTNTGVLREIWHDPAAGDQTDNILIGVPDTHATFLVLREELSQFLSDQGIFRDMLWYVDLLQAQIYAGYIDAQGSAWLKTDFSADIDPLEHTRRILGVDARVTRQTAVGNRQSAIGHSQ